jgi:hypothetical protein
MFLAAVSATLLALALLVLAKPLKARMFPNRKEARRVRLVLERGTPLADLREEVEASEVPLERIVVRPSSVDQEDDAELVVPRSRALGSSRALRLSPRHRASAGVLMSVSLPESCREKARTLEHASWAGCGFVERHAPPCPADLRPKQ